ncbi:MAG: alpha/beta hydrolase [Reyranellaceae bacterium]
MSVRAARLGRRAGLGLLAAGLVGAAGCSPADLLNATVSRDGYDLLADQPYGPESRQTLDLYRPRTPRPDGKAVVFFYGGSWDSGAKGDYRFVGQALAARGFAVVIADYRLYPEVRFPAFVADGAQAVRWAADRLGAERLFVMGHSAGAQIASLLMADTDYLGAAGVDRLRLRGLIGLSGPYDFLPLTSPRLIEIFGGANNRAIQAISFARAPLPPSLLIHGLADRTVLPRNSVNLAEAWRRSGAAAELRLYPGVGHAEVVAAFADLLDGRAPTRRNVVAWMDAT